METRKQATQEGAASLPVTELEQSEVYRTITHKLQFLTSNAETSPAQPGGVQTTVGSSAWTSSRAG